MDEIIRMLKGIGVMVFAIFLVLFAGVVIVGETSPPDWAFVLWLMSPLVAFMGFVYFADARLGRNAGGNSSDGASE